MCYQVRKVSANSLKFSRIRPVSGPDLVRKVLKESTSLHQKASGFARSRGLFVFGLKVIRVSALPTTTSCHSRPRAISDAKVVTAQLAARLSRCASLTYASFKVPKARLGFTFGMIYYWTPMASTLKNAWVH